MNSGYFLRFGIVGALLSGSACARGLDWPSWGRPNAEPTPTPAVMVAEPTPRVALTPTSAAPPVRRLALRLEVLRVEAPVGSFDDESGLWNMLDEAPAPASATVTLRENGFRYAVGAFEQRSAFKKRLDAISDMRVARDQASPSDERPIEIEVTDVPGDMATFVFSGSGRMSGVNFLQARPMMRLECRLTSLARRQIEMRMVPELREPDGPMEFVKTPAGFEQRSAYRGKIFDELAMRVGMREGDFLVIGPTRAARDMPLVATPFFTVPGENVARENLFVLMAETTQRTSKWTNETASNIR